MLRRNLTLVALAVAAVLFVPTAAFAQGKVIKIATQSPLSGGQSAIGTDIKNGAQLAVEQLSGTLAKLGFKVELAPFDDQANPDTGVANAKSIVADPAILAIVGHYNSGVQIPSSEEYHAAGLLNISPANSNPKVTERGYPEIFRVCGRDDVQGAVGAQYAASKGIKSAYVLHDKTAYGQGIAEYFQREAKKLNIRVLGFEGTEEKANFDAILMPILASKAQVIYFGGIFDQSSVLLKQARQKGFKGMFLSDDAFDCSDTAKIASDALLQGAGACFSTLSGPPSVYPDAGKFTKDFAKEFGAPPQPYAAQAYDCVALALNAIEKVIASNGGKFPSRADVVATVKATKDFKGITGTFNFTPKGDLTKAQYFVIQVTSADPAKWANNKIDKILAIAPPS
jgi:branched-chain amino acid transport system substrate-binding protein